MQKLFTTFFLSCMCIAAIAADSTKVLFIGNSLTFYNDMPKIFESIAIKAGFNNIKVAMHAPGGAYVAYTPQGTFAHANNPAVYSLINSEKWDFVVIQDNQGFYVDYVGSFLQDANVIDGHEKLRDAAKANNPCSRVVLFAGWCFKNGYQQSPPIFNTGAEMNTQVYLNYKFINKTIQEIISPIGMAWNRIIKEMPSINLWDSDEAHPSYAGSYLTAATVFSSIFRVSSETAFYKGALDSVTARKFRKVAYETVADSVAPTLLSKYAPELGYSATKLTASTGYVKYEWYRNDTLFTTTAGNTVNITSKGCYQVVCTDNNGCKLRSLEKCALTTGVDEYDLNYSFHIYPNPATDHLMIDMPMGVQKPIQVQIADLSGRIIQSYFSTGADHYRVPLDRVGAGMFILAIQCDDKAYRTTFIKQL